MQKRLGHNFRAQWPLWLVGAGVPLGRDRAGPPSLRRCHSLKPQGIRSALLPILSRLPQVQGCPGALGTAGGVRTPDSSNSSRSFHCISTSIPPHPAISVPGTSESLATKARPPLQVTCGRPGLGTEGESLPGVPGILVVQNMQISPPPMTHLHHPLSSPMPAVTGSHCAHVPLPGLVTSTLLALSIQAGIASKRQHRTYAPTGSFCVTPRP